MLRHVFDAVAKRIASVSPTDAIHAPHAMATADFVWAMGSMCALNRQPFDAELLVQQYPPPNTTDSLIRSARALGFRIKRHDCDAQQSMGLHMPCLAMLKSPDAPGTAEESEESGAGVLRPAILVRASDAEIVLFEAGTNTPRTLAYDEFVRVFAGIAFQLALASKPLKDPDSVAAESNSRFGFAWFVPEVLKHRRVWRDVLLASLVIQLLALGTPLFTQVIIDKVVVHRTESTLVVIGIGLAIFMLFTMLLSWVRQYLVLHTGNRVDAVLGSAVFDHLIKLPPRYFEHRPTGVIAARMHGVETIREFIASAAVTLILDLPFLCIFVGIMLYYSVVLSCISLALIGAIILLSILMAPVFRHRLNRQFLLGARNQAFLTEYISGLETVKSLQMESQLSTRYGEYLAEYLQAGFAMKQVANTYNVIANGVEQLMTLLILIVGAYIVMHSPEFSIGMLIAFQMFASRVSQPMLRIVGIWQQFQQAELSVQRLGDIMNAPTEPYSLIPHRQRKDAGLIEIRNLSFRYSEYLPYLYREFHLTVQPGAVVAVMGPSGCGKSTLAKLLQGFYTPAEGDIRIDGSDIRHLSSNELRRFFGVVPQESVLFSGTIYENLLMANQHATFQDVVEACKAAEIHEVIESLPMGYQAEIGERGVGLSGGQKQRISIARALLKKPRVLIFDEATSSLDKSTAEQFALTINRLRGKVTMLFITHGLPANLQVDAVVQLGGAEVAEHQSFVPEYAANT